MPVDQELDGVIPVAHDARGVGVIVRESTRSTRRGRAVVSEDDGLHCGPVVLGIFSPRARGATVFHRMSRKS